MYLTQEEVNRCKELGIKAEAPDVEELETWDFNGEMEAVDGCIVESDGTCEHGCRSWMLVLGLI